MISVISPARGKAHAPLYQLKVVLLGVAPPVWRRLHVPGNAKLDWLHAALQVAVGWTNSHLHQFTVGEACWWPSAAQRQQRLPAAGQSAALAILVADVALTVAKPAADAA
jgi:hypothetical protein